MEADWQWGTDTENADVQDLRLTFVSSIAAISSSLVFKKVSVRVQLTAGSRLDICYHCVFNRSGRSSLQPELPSPNLENSPCSFTPWLMLALQGKYAGVMMFHTDLIHYNEKDFKLITELLT